MIRSGTLRIALASFASASIVAVAAASWASEPPPPPAPLPAPAPSTPAKVAFRNDPRIAIVQRLIQGGDLEAAAAVCRTILSEKPDCDRATMLLGVTLSKSKRYEDARAKLEAARDSKQDYPERRHANHFLGWACYHLGDLEAARKAFEAHLVAVPGEPDSTFGLGLVALDEDRLDDAQKHFDAALAAFEKAGKTGVDATRVLTRMSDVAMRRGEVERAEALLARAVAANAVQHETWAKVARVKDRLGKTAEADAARANEQRILEALGRRAKQPPAPDANDAPAKPKDAP
jgi:tetratricopeptide (TPR) repeat protein